MLIIIKIGVASKEELLKHALRNGWKVDFATPLKDRIYYILSKN